MVKIAFVPLDSKSDDAEDVTNDPSDGHDDQEKTLHDPSKQVLNMHVLLSLLQQHLGLVQDVLDVEQLGHVHE